MNGLRALTSSYLSQDWELFGATPDEVLVNFVHHHVEDVPGSIAGFESLLASSMTEDELARYWGVTLFAGYDPRDDGFTFREWFVHALEVLRSEAADRAE